MSPSRDLVDAQDVHVAFTFVADMLDGLAADDARWDSPAGDIEWTCRFVAAHIADCGTWYAANLARRSTVIAECGEVSRTASAPVLVDSLRSSGALLAVAVTAAGPDDRGCHPFGMADRSGFAAMGCDEVLVHGADLAAAFDLPYDPPSDICRRVVGRLFPWVRDDAEPWAALQFANGRAALDGVEPERRWMWHCAPLDEWDGKPRRMPEKQ